MPSIETKTWLVAGLATAGVILQRFGWPEAIWAAAGAIALLLLKRLTPSEALLGVEKGTDVHLFLIGPQARGARHATCADRRVARGKFLPMSC